jgi:WD40 repeat protein
MIPHSRFAGALTLLFAVATASGQVKPRVATTPQGVGTGPPVAFTPLEPGKLPEAARARLGSNLFREPNYVSAASLSPDGKLLAVCGGSQTVRFLDVPTGKEIRRIGVREYLRTQQLLWTPDGKQIVTTGYNGINVWDVKDGKLVRQAANPNRDGRDGMIHLSADGKFVAVGSQYENGQVKVIDLSTGSQITTIKPAQNSTVQGAMSPKGELVATWGQHYNRGGPAGDDQTIARTIQLWEAKTGKEKSSLVSDIYQIMCVRFSPDGSKVAAGGNGVIQMWDVESGKVERRFAGRTGQGMQLVFSPDGRILSAAGQDGCVQSWETATGKRAGICDGPVANVAGLQYRPDGQLLAWAVNVNAIELWEVPSGKRLSPQGGHTAAVTSLQFTDNGKTLLSCGNDGKMLRRDLATGKELEPFELKESEAKRRMYGYARGYMGPSYFSPNGKYLVASGSNGGYAAVWDVDAGLELFALSSAGGGVDRNGVIAFSPDSTKLMAMNRYYGRERSFPIPVWDMETGVPLPSLKGQIGDFTCAGFSTDGNILITCSYSYPPNGRGQIAEAWAWDLTTGKTLSRVEVPNAQFTAVQFLDHRLFVPFIQNGQPQRVYDAMSGREARTLEGSNLPMGTAIALSPDRRLLAYGSQGYDYGTPDGSIRPGNRKLVVWEVASGSIRHEFGGMEGHVTSLAFSRDGKTLASGCSDTTVLLWDLSGKPEKAQALKRDDLDELWKSLEGTSARKAEEAMRKLVARPAEAVPFLTERLKPVPGVKPDAARIAKLIADLDSARYAVREAAMRDLERLGNLAKEAVDESLKKATITAEVRERLEKLKDKVNKPDTGVEWVTALRGIEALERIATPEAAAHLKELAAGGDAPPTRMAREAVGRLRKEN